MAVKLDKYVHNYSRWGKQVLKNKNLVPVLKDKATGSTHVIYKGNRLVVQNKSQNVKQSPEANARMLMRNAKTAKQKAYARYLFSQIKK